MNIWVVLVLIVVASVVSYIFGKNMERSKNNFIGSLVLVRSKDSPIEAYIAFDIEPKELKPGQVISMIVSSVNSQENQGS